MSKVNCPHCGGENEIIGFKGKSCDYCGTMIYPQKTPNVTPSHEQGKINGIGEYIVLRDCNLITESEIVAALKENLVNLDTSPIDVFDHLRIDSIEFYFLPMVRVKGHVSTQWSCNQIIKKKREVGQRAIRDNKGNIERWETEYEEYDDYLPKQGFGSSSFDFLTKCGEHIPLPASVSKIYNQIEFAKIKTFIVDWDPALLDNTNVIPQNSIVNLKTEDLKSSTVIRLIGSKLHQLAYECSFGDFDPNERTNEHFSKNLNFDNNNSYIIYFIPFTCVKYHYKNQECEWAYLQCPDIESCNSKVPVDSTFDKYKEDLKLIIKQRRLLAESLSWSRGLLITVGIILTLVFGFISIYQHFSEPWILAFLFVGVLSIIIGCIMYELVAPIKNLASKMNALLGLKALRNKLLRKKNLSNSGGDCKIYHNNESYVKRDGTLYCDMIDSKIRPQTIEEIDQYQNNIEATKRSLYGRFFTYWSLFVVGIIIILTIAGIDYSKRNEIAFQMYQVEEQERQAKEQRKAELRARGDLGKMGFPKGVQEIEIERGKCLLYFDKQGNLTKIQIKDSYHDDEFSIYEISKGKIIKSSHSNRYEQHEFWGDEYMKFPKNFDVTYSYKEDNHTKVSGGEVIEYSEPTIYATINGKEKKLATLKNNKVEWEGHLGHFPIDYVHVNLINGYSIDYTYPNLAMQLLNIMLEMPKDYELVSGTSEKPTEIANFGKIKYYDN